MIKLLLIKLRKLKRLLTIMEYIVDEWVASFQLQKVNLIHNKTVLFDT